MVIVTEHKWMVSPAAFDSIWRCRILGIIAWDGGRKAGLRNPEPSVLEPPTEGLPVGCEMLTPELCTLMSEPGQVQPP